VYRVGFAAFWWWSFRLQPSDEKPAVLLSARGPAVPIRVTNDEIQRRANRFARALDAAPVPPELIGSAQNA
jgi:hypothetical protein